MSQFICQMGKQNGMNAGGKLGESENSKNMAGQPKSTRRGNAPLWIIAVALVTIAGCLVLIVLKRSSTQAEPAPTAEIVEPAADPAPPDPTPSVPVRPKP